MSPIIIVVVLALLDLVGEEPGIVGHLACEQAVELFEGDAVDLSALPFGLANLGV